MKNNIAGLSMSFSHMNFKNIDLISFNSYNSLLDYDITVIDLGVVPLEYRSNETYAGKRLLKEDSSFQFLSDFKRRKEEIKDLLALGKSIYVILPVEPSFYIYTGRQEHSGTGRNRQTTNIVNEFNILDILPININMTAGFGSKISCSADSIYRNLLEIKDMEYYYTTYFNSKDMGIPVAYIANTEKTISKAFPMGEGHLIIFPDVFDEGNYSNAKEYRTVINLFLHTIDDLEEEIKTSLDGYSLPEWTNKYNIFDEENKMKEIEELNSNIDSLKNKKTNTENELARIQKYKLAFTSTGKELETIVYEMLTDMGFKSMPVEHNRADGVFEYEGMKIVTEVKGVNGSSAEKHGAQLEKWVAEFIEKEEQVPKGILIVNGFRKKDLSSRTEEVFPNQMVNYSTKRDHCLISTIQLLGLFIEVKNNPSEKKSIMNKFLSTVGVYAEFKNYKTFL
ncbi:hypothetical protein I6N95_08305 [Vagococcus sp. BWB3-3]|uniref:Uncharacterized protein n=1 Tax=Vagococcus allomyrinae TaxID=2794353 RepID=A0A940P3Y2_9ENTE|nr:hypothetical protein [Vagococcus allomyrinae]MBP1041002.1 hypothetical protein [Vagococcus allomyrinae]